MDKLSNEIIEKAYQFRFFIASNHALSKEIGIIERKAIEGITTTYS
jgi:hypothetical protein